MHQRRHDSLQDNNSSGHSTERYPRQRQHNMLKAKATNVVKTRDKMRDQDQDQRRHALRPKQVLRPRQAPIVLISSLLVKAALYKLQTKTNSKQRIQEVGDRDKIPTACKQNR